MKKKYLFAVAVILIIIICIDLYIKIISSNNSTSGKHYIDLYENNNLYKLRNIYLVILVNIILGAASIFLFLKSRNAGIPKLIVYSLISLAALLTFLNLFSLM